MIQLGRKYSVANTNYRYGFNGKENDNDIENGMQDYGMRIYDGRLGRFLSVDPLTPKYPELTPYQFASNSPIAGIDLDGGELKVLTDWLADKAKASGMPRLSGFVRSFGGLDMNSRMYNIAKHTLRGDFSVIKQEAWSHTGFGIIQGLGTSVYHASQGDKEAQGELLGTATQIIVGGRLVKATRLTENSAPAPLELTNKQSIAANSGNTGAVESTANSVSSTSIVETESVKLQSYGGKGGGHHLLAKKAFEGAENYDLNNALSVPNAEMQRLGVLHSDITGAQMSRYRAFANSGKTLTWDSIENIEVGALQDAGIKPGTAKSLVSRAIKDLKDAGVAGPTRIPWGGK